MEHNGDPITRSIHVHIGTTIFKIDNPSKVPIKGLQTLQVAVALPPEVLAPWIIESSAFPSDQVANIVIHI